MNENAQVIKERYSNLHHDVRAVLNNPNFADRVEELVSEHPLQNVQIDAFGMEVLLVLLRITDLNSFTTNIKQNMEIAMKRAEDISKKTKQEIFLPIQQHLVQKPAPAKPSGENVANDGIAVPSRSALTSIKPKITTADEANQIHNEIPLVDVEIPKKTTVPKEEPPIVAPAPPNVVPTAKEKVLASPSVPIKTEDDSQDIFKKRLEQPVHTPVEENQIGDSKKIHDEVDPNVKEAIEKDPYKESF